MMKIKCILVILLLSPPPIFGSKENLVPLFEDVHTNTKSESSQDKTKMINQPEDHIVAEGRDESEEYPDNNDYYSHPVCGNKPLGIRFGSCICGSESLSGQGDLAYGDSFCCVSPEDECYTEGSNVRCSTGAKHLKSQPCHDHCYNSYTTSEYLWYTASLFCEEENFCLPISQMCSGVCETEEAVCSPALRCSGQGYDNLISEIGVTEYTVQSLGGKITRSHEYCLAVNNDGYYDTISRLDEDKVVTKYVKLFDYNYLETCHSGYGEGIKCEEGDGCAPQSVWCGGTGRVCTTAGGTVGLDNVDLCRNNTFWMDRSCDWYESGNLAAFGARCTGDKKHCTFPWYTRRTANPTFSTTCLDKSDQAFPINTSCVEYNYQFLNTYSKLWCGEWGGTVTKTVCESLVEFYSSHKNDNRIRDPHGCEKSCNTTGAADCLACQHKDYFHCETTGICIHQSNVCDGHPHPQCGGDDEIMYDCHQTYVKRRIVKNYATFICPSVIYPGNVL